MKKTLQSYNDTATIGATNRKLIVPAASQLVLYLLITFLLLTAFNIRRLWDYLNELVFSVETQNLANGQPSALQQLLDSLSNSIILQVVFWVFLGSFIYTLIWFIRNLFINILNDVVADNYVHPSSYNRFHYWESIIVRKAFFGFSLAVLIFYIFAGWRLVNSLADHAYRNIEMFIAPRSVWELIGIALVTIAILHGLVLIFQITVNSWRFIYRDL